MPTIKGPIFQIYRYVRLGALLYSFLFSEFHYHSVVATNGFRWNTRFLSRRIMNPLLCHLSLHLLMMPPAARLALGQGDALRSDCEGQTKGIFQWEPELTNCDYKLATKLFECVFAETNNDLAVWLPKLDSSFDTKKLHSLVEIMNQNSQRLGNLKVEVSSWPATPATKLELRWLDKKDDKNEHPPLSSDSQGEVENEIQNTEQWVEEKLCGLSLCPYTSSLQKAAVGLGSAGVAEGPIGIRHSNAFKGTSNPSPTAILAHAFWQGIQELATLPEDQVATLLILAPTNGYYDDNFMEFAAIFDDLLEPTIKATESEAIVGRALFHPTYDSKVLGHEQLLPGHALPAKMVEGFLDQYSESLEDHKPDLESIANANDAVRWTPHATINLLRRSQLTAAKEVEAASPRKKPNWIYARNVLRLLKTDPLLGSGQTMDETRKK